MADGSMVRTGCDVTGSGSVCNKLILVRVLMIVPTVAIQPEAAAWSCGNASDSERFI